jgi:hypothetical protein
MIATKVAADFEPLLTNDKVGQRMNASPAGELGIRSGERKT